MGRGTRESRRRDRGRQQERISTRASQIERAALERGVPSVIGVVTVLVLLNYAVSALQRPDEMLVPAYEPAAQLRDPMADPRAPAAFKPFVPSGHEGHAELAGSIPERQLPAFPSAESLPDPRYPGGKPPQPVPGLGALAAPGVPQGHGSVHVPGMPLPPDPAGDLTRDLAGGHR